MRARFHALWADASVKPVRRVRSKGMYCPTQMAKPTSGRKIHVAAEMVSLVNRSNTPMMIGSIRYRNDEVAMPPPWTVSPLSNSTAPMNEEAVMSVKATMM
jgi:hypothetical protein